MIFLVAVLFLGGITYPFTCSGSKEKQFFGISQALGGIQLDFLN